MRCRRLCETKPSGKKHVDSSVVADYQAGGERREVLEMALLDCLARHGLERDAYKRVKAYICSFYELEAIRASITAIEHIFFEVPIPFRASSSQSAR